MNPRITDIATRVDQLQEEGFPFLSAVSRVAEELDMDESAIDRVYSIALDAHPNDPIAPEYETLSHDNNYPDPYNVQADWEENLDL